jgi:crotonobetainyl-CoA:carnitine CoA-transferase CaiB-like acyl-CoA transferase
VASAGGLNASDQRPSQAGSHLSDNAQYEADGASTSLPLKGIKVLEFCQVAAGPFCAMLLADFGADVIKIEPPSGDSMRQWPPLNGGYSENFASLNRNKRSIILNLKDDVDRQHALYLIAGADVIIENNRPGTMDRLGLGYAEANLVNPKIIYCSISAYGQSGPRMSQGGFDVTIQAISGIMSVTGEDNGGPVKCGVPITDFGAGLYAAYSILAALNFAKQNGRGTHIDVPMLGASLAISALQTSEYFGTGKILKRLGSAHPRNAPYRAFKAHDGYFVMAAGNDRLWRTVCELFDLEKLATDDQFLTTVDRAKNQEDLRILLEEKFVQHDTQTILSLLEGVNIPCASINSYADILSDEQFEYMGWVEALMLPNGETTKTFGSPIKFSAFEAPIYREPPALDAHRDEIIGIALETTEAESDQK